MIATHKIQDGGQNNGPSAPAPEAGGAVEWLRRSPGWLGWAGLVVLALAAHGLCLQVPFHMDDFDHIVNNPDVTEWAWMEARKPPVDANSVDVGMYRVVSNAFFSLIHGLFGPAPAAFHAWTLLLHLANVLMIRAGGALVLRAVRPGLGRVRAQRAAWCAAALFACHPLLSEGVNYAQNASLQLVTLFTQTAVACLAAFALTRRLRWLAAPLPVIFLAAYTKEVGLIYACTSTALAGAVLLMTHLDWSRAKTLWMREYRLIIIGTLAACALLGPLVEGWFGSLPIIAKAPMWLENFFTQGRLFWTYGAKLFWPVGLCADHQVPFSGTWGDPESLVKTAAALLLAGAAGLGLCFRRYRGACLLLLLGLLPLLARFVYINKELFVEYRVYPVLPWLALLAGWGLSRIWSWRPQALVVMMAVVLSAGATWSARRSVVWSDPAALALDTLRQYPANIRVRTHLQKTALDEGRYEDVERLANEAQVAMAAIEGFNHQAPHNRRYEITMPLRGVICAEHFRTLALVETKGSKAALEHAGTVLARLEQVAPNSLNPEHREFEIGAPLIEVRHLLLKIGPAYDRLRTHPGDPAALAEIQRARSEGLSPAPPASTL
jgi:hypothetical protein